MTKASDNAFPSVLITEGTEPSAPAAGKQRVYIDSTSHALKRTDSSGVDVTVEGPSGLTQNAVAAQESTSSGSYTDLSTSGPAVTITVPASGKVEVTLGAEISNSATGVGIMAIAISGATTTAAPAPRAYIYFGGVNNGGSTSRTTLLTGLSAGSTTFTAKYKSTAGSCSFASREVIAIPVP